MSKTKPQETIRAAFVFREYCALGPGRSLAKLLEHLRQTDGNVTARLRTLETWSSQHHWQERVRLYDEEQSKQQDVIIAEEKAKVLRKGFALMHKRVAELDRLAQKLIAYAEDEEKVWLPDVKAIGNGPNAERVDLVNFNAPLFLAIDKYFKSIAEEVGDRVKKTETAITSLPPDLYEGIGPNDDGVDS